MNLHIWGASTLKNFTDAIRSGFTQEGVDTNDEHPANFTLIQIHGAPAARDDDLKIIREARCLEAPKVFLIHRPDEALLCPSLKSYFEDEPSTKLVFLGDLIFQFPFWNERRAFSSVIPHPYLDFSKPDSAIKPIIGSFTSWGEMRDVRHYFALVECLKDSDVFEFGIGGSGLDNVLIPEYIRYHDKPFVPHFNVQLYHLRGKKRHGESSGSLHKGISIPVIFEANGAERLEGFMAIKIEADDDLESIDFEKASNKMLKLAEGDIKSILESNWKVARRNTVRTFARSVLEFLAH